MEININPELVNALAAKFGMLIDWTAENVYPQIVEILVRYRTYELVTCGGYVAISIILLIYAFFMGRALIKDYDISYDDFPEGKTSYQFLNRKYFDFYTNSSGEIRLDDIKVKGGVAIGTTVLAIVMGFCMMGCNLNPFLKWLFIPEIQFYQLLVG